jgi:hypothetical protein
MSITNREQANKYYTLINELVDNYIDKWKIRPSRLVSYLKPGSDRFNKFLMRNNLSEVKGADRILMDIIEDRASMEYDGVITFESFKLFESDIFKTASMKECLYRGIEKADLKMEKVIANYFDTSLGSIDVIDSDKHIFRLENWEGDNKNVIIYHDSDLDIINSNIVEHLFNNLSDKEIELTEKIKISLDKLIDKETFGEKIRSFLTDEKIIETITDLLDGYKYENKSSDYHIWIKLD